MSWTDGMVHISEIAPFRVERVSDFIKGGYDSACEGDKNRYRKRKISLSIE